MEMNDEAYRALMLRFALELDEIGVTENMRKLIEGLCQSAPNRIAASAEETTDRFVYRHDGYMIEAKCTVTVVVKTCK
jgi:hypothetical protein